MNPQEQLDQLQKQIAFNKELVALCERFGVQLASTIQVVPREKLEKPTEEKPAQAEAQAQTQTSEAPTASIEAAPAV